MNAKSSPTPLFFVLLLAFNLLSYSEGISQAAEGNQGNAEEYFSELSKEVFEYLDRLKQLDSSDQTDDSLYVYHKKIAKLVPAKITPTQLATLERAMSITLYYDLQRLQEAKDFLEKALENSKSAPPSVSQVNIIQNLVFIHLDLYKAQTAIDYALQGLNISRENHFVNYERAFLHLAARVFILQESWEQAIDYNQQALALALQTEDNAAKYGAYLNLATCLYKSDAFEEGLRMMEKSEFFLDQIYKSEKRVTNHLFWKGMMKGQIGDEGEAIEMLEEVKSQYDSTGSSDRRIHVRLELGRILLMVDESKRVIQLVEEAQQIEGFYESNYNTRVALVLLYSAQERLGDFKTAYENFTKFHEFEIQLDSINNARQVNELVQQYRTKEQKQVILQQEQQIENERAKRRFFTLALLFSSILLFSAFALIYYLFNIRRRLNQQKNLIEQQANELLQLNQAQTNFFTNITHEFRTPLTIILGLTKSDKQHPKAFELIHRNAQKLLLLINQLLELSKLESQNITPQYEQINIKDFVGYLVNSFQPLAQLNQIRLAAYDELTEELWMDVDEVKLQQVISNLLANALKFTKAGGTIIVNLSKSEYNLVLKVKDTGIGIAVEALPHIFDRFYQADKRHTTPYQGTGIGLALVKELVELMGGTVTVESQLQKGTTFTLNFPIQQQAAMKADAFKAVIIDPRLLPTSTETTEEINSNLIELLIIEDNDDLRSYLQNQLQDQYQLKFAVNGKEGIHKALAEIPDLIISDVMMPDKDGFEVVETLKNDERTSHIPILLLTAKATQKSKLKGLAYGADEYLMKPFDITELKLRLKNLLYLRQQIQAKYATKHQVVENKDKEQQFLQKLETKVLKQLDNSAYTVDEFAGDLHLSYNQLYRKLKALLSITPSAYINQIRLKRAYELLMNTNLSIKDIAYQTGYTDPNYFTRSFKKEYSKSPNNIRKNMKIKN